eukprot:m.75853 g.75853  ORF g.75853 m.75853 type:complete len:57 (+) comp35960_c0_seq5:1014-1184(+)
MQLALRQYLSLEYLLRYFVFSLFLQIAMKLIVPIELNCNSSTADSEVVKNWSTFIL